MRHVGGRNDVIVGRMGEWAGGLSELIEEKRLIRNDKLAISRLAEFTASLTVGILIDNDDSPIIGLPARLGLRQLGRVEGAITSTADHDNVSQRMSLPPSITRTVPVA